MKLALNTTPTNTHSHSLVFTLLAMYVVYTLGVRGNGDGVEVSGAFSHNGFKIHILKIFVWNLCLFVCFYRSKAKKSTYGSVVKAVCRIIGVPDMPKGPEMILWASTLGDCGWYWPWTLPPLTPTVTASCLPGWPCKWCTPWGWGLWCWSVRGVEEDRLCRICLPGLRPLLIMLFDSGVTVAEVTEPKRNMKIIN